MKYLSNTIPVLAAFLMTFLVLPMQVQAQQSMDTSRLNRDINIMENILSEMFRYRALGNNEENRTLMVVEDIYRNSSGRNIRGTYLPGFGVIFQVPNPTSNFYLSNDNVSSYAFYYGDSDPEAAEELTAENVTNRIVEFLMDYGSTIGQLPSDEHVMVIYGGAPDRSRNIVWNFIENRIDRQDRENRIPVISASITKSNLDAYRAGSLSESQFRSRVDISESEANQTSSKDLRVMANIFETAFEGGDEASFRVRGSVDYLQLDNFGALFFFDAGYGSAGTVFRVQTIPSVPKIRAGSDSNGSRAMAAAVEEMRKTLSQQQEKVEQKREETRQKTVAAYKTFKTDLKEYLVDYGRTLSSVESGQHVLLSITLNSSVEDIPDRIDVQVAKSVLERMDQGNLSREQAISQVSLKEY